jgi:hypothetical protein
MIAEDPSDKVREQVTFGLSVSSDAGGADDALINTARNEKSQEGPRQGALLARAARGQGRFADDRRGD